jgi:hypothetical protein
VDEDTSHVSFISDRKIDVCGDKSGSVEFVEGFNEFG